MNHYFQKLLEREYFGMKLGLGKIQKVLEGLGHPERKFPSIHIAGTNGKGSTAAMIASVLKKAGFRVGLYTSPHLVDFRERVQIDGEMIAKKECEALIEELQRLEKNVGAPLGTPLSFFEFMTVLAFLYFSRQKVDIAVIETGLGGRFDATNVLNPLVSVITTIGLDHTEHLGKTLEAIAFEKAGIIKPGVPVVCGEMSPEALGVIRNVAQGCKSPFAGVGGEGRAPGRAERVSPVGRKGESPNLRQDPSPISLLGHHQQKNAACALAAIEILKEKGWPIPAEAIIFGLKNTKWPGRLEMISKNPPLLLDGAHNPQAMAALRLFLEEEYRSVPITLVLGVMADKDIRGLLDEIVPLADQVITTRPNSRRALDPSVLAEMVRGYGKEVVVTKNVKEAMEKTISPPLMGGDEGEGGHGITLSPTLPPQGGGGLTVITGSLFTVGEARELFVNRDYSQRR
ncbi:MAG: bifunctional folylpolyglutamate synthase/dihydrofolate synthase [Deltaproteobacteria bacterium]|nr:bifunctional folylpolyglutamate synthase/dihydrofolate synthase [Deltaproteobacteria bacterium]